MTLHSLMAKRRARMMASPARLIVGGIVALLLLGHSTTTADAEPAPSLRQITVGIAAEVPVIRLAHCCHPHPLAPYDNYCCHPASTYAAPAYGVGPTSVRGVSRRTSRRTSRRVSRRR